MVSRIDPVARRLASAGDDQAVSLLDWLDGQQQRDIMSRRAFSCILAGWLLLTVAAIVSWLVSGSLARDVQEVFGEQPVYYQEWKKMNLTIPLTVTWLPIVLGVVSLLLLAGGIIGWRMDIIPGLRATRSAIDWASASDAVTRLLAVGCTYPEAFRTTAEISRTRSSRNWLLRAAERVEQGRMDVTSSSDGDTATLELFVEPSQAEPHRQWQSAAEHFSDTAQRRLALLLGTVPAMSTIASGFLIWLSISASLGWMWRAAVEMLRGFA